MIIPIKTKPSKTLSRVEKRFFFFLDREAFSLGCLLGAGVGSDGLGEIFFSGPTDETESTFGRVLASVMSSKTTLESRL